ncbi:hypothetical protein P691DRAFT_704836 [Macrolepiota fuliginosa MF-IS2]|uniref:Conidiation-specific protein 13 n=1 Tax=Macrolepiota fuliginosa MF-IS2 TaxID=1400762 RepID=A0A9P5XFX7_9AGAR|nr:hypothetical protein P691DRAFT_704836 [Macrolepiota fuliginosa MF-IS2]
MAGPSPSFSRTRVRWSPGFFATSLLIRLPFFILALDFFDVGVFGHIIRSPDQSNLTSPLTNLTPEQPNFDSFNIGGALYSPASNYVSLPSLPPSCSMYNAAGNECPTTDMMAVNVTYDDCTDAWTLCHCGSANMSLDDAVERLGKVPVGLRKFIAMTLVLPGEETHAYSLTSGDLHMFGDCSMETWVHEATHSYDYAFGDPISGGQPWLDALNADSCATDTYGTSDAAEEFAQMSVLKTFSLIYGALPSGWDPACMSNQLAYMDTLPLYDKTTLFADTCATSPTSVSTPDGRLGTVRAIKIDGPSPVPGAPLRINPNANPTAHVPSSTSEALTPSSTLIAPISVGKDPTDNPDAENKKGNAAVPLLHHSRWQWSRLLYSCVAVVSILGVY